MVGGRSRIAFRRVSRTPRYSFDPLDDERRWRALVLADLNCMDDRLFGRGGHSRGCEDGDQRLAWFNAVPEPDKHFDSYR